MTKYNPVEIHDQTAAGYDEQVKEYHSYGHEILFGLCFEFCKTDGQVLDLGIGTGLSSKYYPKLGMNVTGVDASESMLKECRKKGFAHRLIVHDIGNSPLPLEDSVFDMVIACGLFHFYKDLRSVFQDVSRVLVPNGIFGFTLSTPSSLEVAPNGNPGFWEVPTVWGVPITKHSDEYASDLSKDCGFEMLKKQKVLIDGGPGSRSDLLFTVYVCRCTGKISKANE